LWRYHLRPLPLSFAYPCACLHRPLPGLTTSDLHGLGCAVQVSHATLSVSLLPLACRCVMGGCRQIPVQNTLSPDGTRMRDTNTCLYALCLWTPTNFTTTCVELCVGPAFPLARSCVCMSCGVAPYDLDTSRSSLRRQLACCRTKTTGRRCRDLMSLSPSPIKWCLSVSPRPSQLLSCLVST